MVRTRSVRIRKANIWNAQRPLIIISHPFIVYKGQLSKLSISLNTSRYCNIICFNVVYETCYNTVTVSVYIGRYIFLLPHYYVYLPPECVRMSIVFLLDAMEILFNILQLLPLLSYTVHHPIRTCTLRKVLHTYSLGVCGSGRSDWKCVYPMFDWV